MVGTYFLIYERDNLDKLYGILLLRKFSIITGRYLFALCLGIINGIGAGILAYIISPFVNARMDNIALMTYLCASFLYYCLYIALVLPIYFKYTFSKGQVFVNLPLMLVVAGIILSTRQTIQAGELTQYINSHQYMIWASGIGMGLILLTVLCSLSYLIYGKSER